MDNVEVQVRSTPDVMRWRALWDWLLKPPENEEDAVPLPECPRPCPTPRNEEPDV